MCIRDRIIAHGEKGLCSLGVRGDAMHTWGMKSARYVVAVHPDPDAPILKQADAVMVGDPAQVAKELAEALSKN